MLDYFLLQGYVEMTEDGSIVKTATCPEILDFHEDKNGIIKFHYKAPVYGGFNEPEDWEDQGNWMDERCRNAPYIIANKDGGTQVLNQSI